MDSEAVVFDAGNRQLKYQGKVMNLTESQYRIIQFLRSTNRTIPDTMLARYVCSYDVELKAIDVAVCRLRSKIKANGLPELIRTKWGVGYQIGFPISVVNPDDMPVIIAGSRRKELEQLLYSHPDHAAADKILADIIIT